MRKLGTALLALIVASAALASPPAALAGDKPHHKPHAYRTPVSTTVSGTVIAANGDLVQLRQDNGVMVAVNEQSLLRAGSPLQIGAHYVLQGFFSNNLFVAQNNGYDRNAYPANGYPHGANATVRGVITSISGNRVTVLQGLFTTITIDDQRAQASGAAQNLYVGRSVTAYGFWSGNVFYAMSIG